ncbi:MAG TPA: Crp/Fnr family transcriptional regulator [Clostridium sp.]|jgi:CRP/FNR family transcriptional regulator|nr:Crp/Fnr family transcriptional regulator [Clostridia bacterium]HCW03228.1 Crp/Fnr family transcriptional regulator [Clostridium sp.]
MGKEKIHRHSQNYEGQHTCPSEQNHACISLVPIFNHLEEKQMEEISKVTRSVSYKKKEIIYSAGEKSDSLYIVASGKVRIYRLSESGKEQLVRILKAGDFTGELALFNESIHEAYAETMVDTNICMITRKDLQVFLMKYPSISLMILSEFSKRLESSEKQSARFATEKVERRIALFLTECVEDDEETREFQLPMSKKDLASYLGTTPETLSRKLTEFEDLGYIKQIEQRKIRILDFDGLLFLS